MRVDKRRAEHRKEDAAALAKEEEKVTNIFQFIIFIFFSSMRRRLIACTVLAVIWALFTVRVVYSPRTSHWRFSYEPHRAFDFVRSIQDYASPEK